MPTLQVLEREDPNAYNQGNKIAEALARGIELAGDLQYKKGLIAYNKAKIAQEARVAETEVAKLEAARRAAVWERAEKAMEIGMRLSKKEGSQGIDPDKWGKYMASVTLNDPELAEIYGGDELKKMVPSYTPNEELQGALAEATKGSIPGSNPAGVPSNGVGASTGTTPATGSGMRLSSIGMSPSGVSASWENRDEQAAWEARKNQVALQAKKEEGETPTGEMIKRWEETASSAMRSNNVISSLLNNPDFENYMGMVRGPKRAFAQYTSEGGRRFKAFMSQSMEMVNIYRKMITGAQASVIELNNYIKTVLGNPEDDLYDTFLMKNMVATYTTLGNINQQIGLNYGYDTKALKETSRMLTAQAETLNAKLKERGVDIDNMVNMLPIDQDGKDIAKIMIAAGEMGQPVSYEDAKSVVIGGGK